MQDTVFRIPVLVFPSLKGGNRGSGNYLLEKDLVTQGHGVVQSVECLTLGSASSHDLKLRGWSPTLG